MHDSPILFLSLFFFFWVKCLKQNLRENSSENILSSANRLLLHEGKLMLAGKVPDLLVSRDSLTELYIVMVSLE